MNTPAGDQGGGPEHVVLLIHPMDGSRSYSRYLSDEGYRVLQARNDDEGYDWAVSLIPDCIVLDLDSSATLITRLRNNTGTKHIPLIGLAELPLVDAVG